MQDLKLLIKVSRPISWVIAPAIYIGGASLLSFHISSVMIIQIALLSFPYCLFLYGINDIYDHESDLLNPRKGSIQGAQLAQQKHRLIKRYSLITVVLLLISSFVTLNILNIFGMILLLFFSYYYSAPPLRFKDRTPLDSFSNGIIYFLGPLLIGYQGSLTMIPIDVILLSICVMGIHAYSTIADYTVDQKIGDKTFAVVYGIRWAAIIPFIVVVVSLFFNNYNLVSSIGELLTKIYLVYIGIIFLATTIFPYESIGKIGFYLLYLGFLVVSIPFVLDVLQVL